MVLVCIQYVHLNWHAYTMYHVHTLKYTYKTISDILYVDTRDDSYMFMHT